jgi:hypothetical protein
MTATPARIRELFRNPRPSYSPAEPVSRRRSGAFELSFSWRGPSAQRRNLRCRERREQTLRLDLQRLRDADDVHERYVAFGALDLADVVAIEAGQFGEAFLREVSLGSDLAEPFAEQLEDLVAHS